MRTPSTRPSSKAAKAESKAQYPYRRFCTTTLSPTSRTRAGRLPFSDPSTRRTRIRIQTRPECPSGPALTREAFIMLCVYAVGGQMSCLSPSEKEGSHPSPYRGPEIIISPPILPWPLATLQRYVWPGYLSRRPAVGPPACTPRHAQLNVISTRARLLATDATELVQNMSQCASDPD